MCFGLFEESKPAKAKRVVKSVVDKAKSGLNRVGAKVKTAAKKVVKRSAVKA